jgi:hypothetical protein
MTARITRTIKNVKRYNVDWVLLVRNLERGMMT